MVIFSFVSFNVFFFWQKKILSSVPLLTVSFLGFLLVLDTSSLETLDF